MLIPSFTLIPYNETICFVNLSGSVELRVRKDRIDRYFKNNDKLFQYLRRKLDDITIFKITPYESISAVRRHDSIPESYLIIRHPLQDFNKFKQVYDQCSDNPDFMNKHIDLFNNLDFVKKFCQFYPQDYRYLPDRFKSNKKILVYAIRHGEFEFIPEKVKNNRKLAIFMVKIRSRYFHVCGIYQHLPYKFRKDPEFVSLALTNMNQNYVYQCIIEHIPDNLISDPNFILNLNIKILLSYRYESVNNLNSTRVYPNINTAPDIYRYLPIELQRNYDILLKLGYCFIGDRIIYNSIMTPEMKSDVELHRKLMKLNPGIYDLMSTKLKYIIAV